MFFVHLGISLIYIFIQVGICAFICFKCVTLNYSVVNLNLRKTRQEEKGSEVGEEDR